MFNRSHPTNNLPIVFTRPLWLSLHAVLGISLPHFAVCLNRQ